MSIHTSAAVYRTNTYLSWELMASILRKVEGENFVAHLRPLEGVGYDCLSLIHREPGGPTTTRIMLNRDGGSAWANGVVISDIWIRTQAEGVDATADILIETAELLRAPTPRRSSAVTATEAVVEWIESHLNEDFEVRPASASSGQPTSIEVWPIEDHGPDVELHLSGNAVRRVSLVDPVQQLATDIARCSEVKVAIADDSHACNRIVNCQEVVQGRYRQVPEAWVGNLARARLLVVSSNPSISSPETPTSGEDYPLAGWDDVSTDHPEWSAKSGRLIDFQTARLAQRRERPYVNGRAQFLCSDGVYRGNDKVRSTTASQTYWKAAFRQGEELFGPDFDLESDLCLTEIVHCKSKREVGVREAATFCAERFLCRVLDLSPAPIVVIGGSKARDILHAMATDFGPSADDRWDIDENFGYHRRTTVRPASHVGLYSSSIRQCILIACQQMSYASNRFRFVKDVIGTEPTARMQRILSDGSLPRLSSRREAAALLGLS